MTTLRKQIINLIEHGKIPADKIDAALSTVKITPVPNDWRAFLDAILLWLGGLALAFSALFFIAYNWDDIGRFAKFGMVEVLIVLAVGSYWKLGENKTIGKVSLLVATVFLGVLLALYGQTYQTGADTWQLFFTWALLMLPWAIVSRFPAIWIVWVVLINLSIVLYHQIFRGALWLVIGSEANMLWLTFAFNTVILIIWEYLAIRWHWLSERWGARLLVTGSGIPITWLCVTAIFEHQAGSAISGLVWVVWLGAVYYAYQKIKPDLFMLAGGCLSGIIVVVMFLSKHLLERGGAGAFLLLAFVVIGLGAGAAMWLRNVHREWHS